MFFILTKQYFVKTHADFSLFTYGFKEEEAAAS